MRNVVLIAILPAVLAAQAWSARIVFEAESAETLEAPMVKVTPGQVPPGREFIEGASGNAYLQIPPGSGNPPEVNRGKAVYTVTVDEPGLYVLWCRVYWEDECSNSISVQINDGPVFAIGLNAVFKRWHWVRSPPRLPLLNLPAGQHTLTLLNREDGICIDQIALSNERRFIPVDIEPVTIP